jgi:hypothetical protein
MSLSKRQVRQLEGIIASAQAVLDAAGKKDDSPAKAASSAGGSKRVRRSGKELVAFRKALKAERKKGVPVAEIARKNDVSPAYIYQL